jgi:hypothetical protein
MRHVQAEAVNHPRLCLLSPNSGGRSPWTPPAGNTRSRAEPSSAGLTTYKFHTAW